MPVSETPPLEPSPGVDRGRLATEVAARRAALDRELAARGLDAVVVASEANCQYLTGYETTFWGNKSKPFTVVYAQGGRATVVCHTGEEPSVRLDAIDVELEPYGAPVDIGAGGAVQLDYQEPAADAVARATRELGVAAVGLELSWHFLPGFTPRAQALLEQGLAGIDVRDASPALWAVRRRKSAWEVEQMRLAAGVAERAHRGFAAAARVGMSERELNRLLVREAYDAGAEKIGYTGIVAGIDRAPLGGPTDRRWESGQLVMVDICLQLNGYFADFNRIYGDRPPNGEQASAYAEVVEALARGREAAAAGAAVGAVAAAIAGDEPSLYDRVGHGLGLEMPEPPSLSPLDTTPLEPGEVICLEPNRMVPGVGWLVSEEEVVITDSGHELLSPPFPASVVQVG